MTKNRKLDDELRRVLEGAEKAKPETADLLRQMQPTQSMTWPWQVPQAPAYTSDSTPNS